MAYLSLGEPRGKKIGTIPFPIYLAILAGKITTDDQVRQHIKPLKSDAAPR